MFHRLRKVTVNEDADGRLIAVVTGTWFGVTFTAQFTTGPNGKGLWIWDETRHYWRQVVGISQFKARSAYTLRRRLRDIVVWKQGMSEPTNDELDAK
jgi:hypothetical protein